MAPNWRPQVFKFSLTLLNCTINFTINFFQEFLKSKMVTGSIHLRIVLTKCRHMDLFLGLTNLFYEVSLEIGSDEMVAYGKSLGSDAV